MVKTIMSYTDELKALVNFAKQPIDEDTPVEIRINLRKIPADLGELGTHRCIEYEIVDSKGDTLIGGQGWSLDDAFKEAKQDFFDIMNDT